MSSTVLRPDVSTSHAAHAAPSADPDGLPVPRRHAAVAAILGAIVLVVLDSSIANVALPSIAQQLHATPSDTVWVVTAYQLAIVMFLLPASAVGERYGYRRVFAGGIALFTAASVLCALAPSLPWLVAARCLQGLGSAAVMPLGLALLRYTYPRRLLGQAIAWNALTVAGASAAGPAVGAALLSIANWPWLFAVNLPVGVLVLIACTGLPDPRGSGRSLAANGTSEGSPRSVAFNVQGFRVAVNKGTGEIKILRSVQAADAGVVANPMQCRGQVEGGVAQAIGAALYEEMVIDATGRVTNPKFRDYHLPSFADVPRTEVFFAETSDTIGPLGAKSMSESPYNPVAAALGNAIADATGIRFTAPPFKPDRLFPALHDKFG